MKKKTSRNKNHYNMLYNNVKKNNNIKNIYKENKK